MMSTAQEAVVLASLDALHGAAGPDFDRLLSLFSPDADYQGLVPARTALKGHEAIRDELERKFRGMADCRCEVITMVSNDRCVITERLDHVTINSQNKRISVALVAIYEINPQGQITGWREYFDASHIGTQLGLSSEQMDSVKRGIPPG
jgi:limonene-1,2-epoxide hydrolase